MFTGIVEAMDVLNHLLRNKIFLRWRSESQKYLMM